MIKILRPSLLSNNGPIPFEGGISHFNHFCKECLESNKLETAASYLIILQNLEKLVVAREDATKLLNYSLQRCKWRLAADLSRFLKAIGDGDQCSPRHPTLLNANIYPVVAPTVKQPISGKPVNSSYSRDKYGQVTDDKNCQRVSANILPRVPSETKISHSGGSHGLNNRTVSSPVLQRQIR